MAGANDLDDPYFGYDIESLRRDAMIMPPLLKAPVHTGPPLLPGTERGFYSDFQEGADKQPEYQETPPPDQGVDDIESIYLQFKGEQPGTADDLSIQWQNVGLMLETTSGQLHGQTVTMAEQWKSPQARQLFLQEVGKTLAYMDVWKEAAYTNSSTLRELAAVMREGWEKMRPLYDRWKNAELVSPDRIEMASKRFSNTEQEEERIKGAYGDDYRSLQENYEAYSYLARILASEMASKYAPLIAKLDTGRALMMHPLNARQHPGAMDPSLSSLGPPPGGGPGGAPPGGAPPSPPPGSPPPGSPPPGSPPPSPPPGSPPPGSPPPGSPPPFDKRQGPPTPPPVPDLPPVPDVPPGPQALGAPPGFPPLGAPPIGYKPNPFSDGTNKPAPTLTNGAPGDAPPSSAGNTKTPPAGPSNSLFPPGTINPPPGGVPPQPQKPGNEKKPGMPGSGLGSPPPGSAPPGTRQESRPTASSAADTTEAAPAFQVPPSVTPPVLGDRKPNRPAQRANPVAHSGLGGPPGATPPVLANPRHGSTKPQRPVSPRPAVVSELVEGVATGTAPVLDGRFSRPVTAGPGADVPPALRGKEPVSTPERKARPEFYADRTKRVPQKVAETAEAPVANAWEVDTPGGPVVAGSGGGGSAGAGGGGRDGRGGRAGEGRGGAVPSVVRRSEPPAAKP
jgi:hypothetical protein